jgi:hypothetical protein
LGVDLTTSAQDVWTVAFRVDRAGDERMLDTSVGEAVIGFSGAFLFKLILFNNYVIDRGVFRMAKVHDVERLG